MKSKINVLVYPMLSVDNVNLDSNYIAHIRLMQAMKNDFNFFYILDAKRKIDPRNMIPEVKYIYIPLPKGKAKQVIYFNPLLFHEIFRKYPIHVVWNNVVEQGSVLKYLNDTIIPNVRMKVFNYHHYVIHDSLEKSSQYDPRLHIRNLQITNSLLVDVNYFHTKHCYEMFIHESTKVLNNEMLETLKSSCTVKLGGYMSKRFAGEKYEDFTFIYNHRLDGYKNYSITFDLFNRMWKEGLKFKVLVTGNNEKISRVMKFPFVYVKEINNVDNYMRELSRCHANVTNSRHETYCVSIAESMYHDQVIIAPNAITFPELLGTNYPYLFDSIEQQYKFMVEIVKNNIREYKHDTKKLEIQNHAKFIGQKFTALYDSYGDLLHGMKNATKQNTILNTLNSKKSFTFHEAMVIATKNFGTQAMPMQKIAKVINQLGFNYDTKTDKFKR